MACQIHPGFKYEDAIFALDKPKTFISFICFLIQFKFKLLNIEDTNQQIKDTQRKQLCNILFMMLENCSEEFYYYPFRALLEFYSDKAHERSLGKRLNAESLLAYKIKKVTMGRVLQLTDFKKNLINDSRHRQ